MPSPIARTTQLLSRRQKNWLRVQLTRVRRLWIERFRTYEPEDLRALLSEMGVSWGDTILLHSSFKPTNGFRGTPSDLLNVIRSLIGDDGSLVMMSMPYLSSTSAYLASFPLFDVRRTPSRTGIVSEVFRRQRGVARSLSATHPVVALGAKADWLVEGHGACAYPCGPGSPFEKMYELRGKMLFFDLHLPSLGFTFVHYIEHQLRDRLSFPLYEESPLESRVVDHQGKERTQLVYTFTAQASRRRNVGVIIRAMQREGTALSRRIGNTDILIAGMAEALDTALRLADDGTLPFDPEIGLR